jgi:hypothetical protein
MPDAAVVDTSVAHPPDIAPETRKDLSDQAAARGLSVGEYIETLIVASRLPRTREELLAQVMVPPGQSNGLAEIIGRWPGEETDEEINAALEEIS